jgi:hypothetical protein
LLDVHVSVAVPDPVTVPGLIAVQVRPDGTVSVRVTVPANPLRPVTVIVDDSEDPTVAAAGLLATTVKSTKLKLAVVE